MKITSVPTYVLTVIKRFNGGQTNELHDLSMGIGRNVCKLQTYAAGWLHESGNVGPGEEKWKLIM